MAKNKKDREHLNKVAELGCVVCRNEGLGATPPELHHIRDGYGRGQKAPDSEAIPLCAWHHRFADGTPKFRGHIAYHRDSPEFEKRYGTERELLAQVMGEIYGTRRAIQDQGINY